tara:strand:+ start:91508 stop:92185 length:678 start_codon:yes stop_codon:yes gene_type:complete
MNGQLNPQSSILNPSKAKLYIVAAPPGAGKSTLVNALIDKIDDVMLSISYTTRSQRKGEVDKVNYNFIDHDEFEAMIKANEFLEYANVFSKISNNYYGTGKAWVEQQLAGGHNVILEIDWQGAQQIFKTYPDAVGIFILPPSMAVLEQRLHKRGREDKAEIDSRMSIAKDEISHCEEYHYVVINDDFEHTLEELAAIFKGSIPLMGPGRTNFPNKIQDLLTDLLA